MASTSKVDDCDISDLSLLNDEELYLMDEEEEDEKIEFTSSADLKSVKPYDNTVEIVGYVDGIEAPRLVGAKSNKIFKFFLNNQQGERVQITCWNSECDRIEPLLRTNFIAHIDGAYAKPCLVNNFNKGSVAYELIIQSNTIVNILGKHTIQEADIPSELVDLSFALNYRNLIRTQGYIKSNFVLIKKQNSMSADYGCGSITDGKFKLEVRFTDMDIENVYHKGDHVEVIGYMQLTANPVYLLMKKLSNLRLVDVKKLSVSKLIKGNKPLEKLWSLPLPNQAPAEN